MTTYYNQIAGQSLQRLAGLSDGVFAIVMTLLVLELRLPVAEEVATNAALWDALVELAPKFLVYAMSFLTLGMFWVGQQTELEMLERSDRRHTWVTIVYLMVIALVPFSTSLLGEHIHQRLALAIYWINILLIGLALLAQWSAARRGGLLKADTPDHHHRAVLRRILVGQSLYAFGALLCIVSVWLSIAFIFAVQIQFAIGLRFRPFSWL